MADMRILSMDRGGIGGIVPLEYLGLLQQAVGQKYSRFYIHNIKVNI